MLAKSNFNDKKRKGKGTHTWYSAYSWIITS